MRPLWEYLLHGENVGRRILAVLLAAASVISAAALNDQGFVWSDIFGPTVLLPAVVAILSGLISRDDRHHHKEEN